MTEQNGTNFNADDFTITSGAMELNDAVIKSVVSDSGTSTPSAHVLTVLGSNGLNTTATGSTLTINASTINTDYEYISSVTADDDAYVAFTNLSSTYETYVVYFEGVIPATSAVYFYLRTSTDNGSNYDSETSDYYWQLDRNDTDGSVSTNQDSSANGIRILWSLGNASGASKAGTVVLYKPSAVKYATIYCRAVDSNTSASRLQGVEVSGRRLAAADVDAVQFIMSSGNITEGTFKLYGIKAS